ncbi:MAG: RnfABCDGE type electron transport complex subunit D [Spirochaetaceae bacterium]|nr:MAG: RnfABCDGE type electron transport complex subunit D [Spirochaetaceae bacterium]
MKRVLFALIPAVIASIYFFGWRSLVILAIVNAAGFLTEFLFLRHRKEPGTSAVFVSNFILALSLPPTIPYWMAALGAVVGILFGKMAFGGFGKNVFNPAMVGRAFVYISFGGHLTASWANPFVTFPGGFARYGAVAADIIGQATPLSQFAKGVQTPWLHLFLGNISGSLGETSAMLLILGGLYIVWKKAAAWQIVVGGFTGFLVAQTTFWLTGLSATGNPLYMLFAGSFIFGVFFVITEPVSASQTTNPGRWIYGIFFGIMVVVIRTFSAWPAAVMFATLLSNMFAPLLDYVIKQQRQKRKTA